MKTTNESYLKQTKRAFTLSKFSRYKFNQNSKTDLTKSIKTFNKTTNRLENLYLTKEERNHKNWVKRHILVKTFTFKMKNKIVSTVSVSQDEINILNSITPLTPTKSINKINSQIKRLFTLRSFNVLSLRRKNISIFKFMKNYNRLADKVQNLTTTPVSQDEINIFNSITPLTPTKSINKMNSQIKRVFILTQLNYFKSDLFSYFKNLNRLRNKIDSLTYQRNLLIAS